MIAACAALAGVAGLAIVVVTAAVDQMAEKSGGESVFQKVLVQDGDTLATRSGRHVRLLCIDAPERDQPGGIASQNALKSIVSNGAKIRGLGKDSYGRLLAVASVRKGGADAVVNTEMIRLGHAWVYRRFANDCGIPRRELCAAERAARLARLGLWDASNPVPPWQWRRGRTRPPNRFPACEK